MGTTTARILQWTATTRRRNRVGGAVLRTAAPVLPHAAPPRQPIFILGSPRSGTTMLVDLLDRSPSLLSFARGSQFLWEMFHTIQGSGWRSHVVGPEEITARERRVVYWSIDELCGGKRYLDKFPRNCLRGEYLYELFPDARFVAIHRDGRSAVSSLITGWQTAGKFGQGSNLPVTLDIAGYGGGNWKFLVPPGWREFATGHTLAEVCAFQWSEGNAAILRAQEHIPPEQWTEVRYEEFLDAPRATASRLLERLDLPQEDEVLSWAANLGTHVSRTAVSDPSRDKWRTEHRDEIASIIPQIEPMMRTLGYPVEA
jgi:Sulfotransferase family